MLAVIDCVVFTVSNDVVVDVIVVVVVVVDLFRSWLSRKYRDRDQNGL